jgi:TonB family protein
MSASSIGARVVAAVVVVVMNAGAAVPAQDAVSVPLKDLKRHVGEEVLACGRAVLYDCDDAAGALWLYLEKIDGGTAVVIPRDYWPDSAGRSLTDRVLSSTVCARGTVRKDKGVYRVIVNGAARIDVRDRPPGPPVPFAPAAWRTCAAGVTPPRLRTEVKPSYTRDAMRAKEQGKMYLEAEVREDGSVGDVQVLTTLAHGLVPQAVSALKQWRFEPARLDGRAVPVVVTVEMMFTLK